VRSRGSCYEVLRLPLDRSPSAIWAPRFAGRAPLTREDPFSRPHSGTRETASVLGLVLRLSRSPRPLFFLAPDYALSAGVFLLLSTPVEACLPVIRSSTSGVEGHCARAGTRSSAVKVAAGLAGFWLSGVLSWARLPLSSSCIGAVEAVVYLLLAREIILLRHLCA